ncbi:nuclear transport factor 2 family protein [Glaciibacter sp. 2TAF33]|uniref:nuclear transport factor 2 family protein n=1 Tax=Glaciibacter sp. 2TAF33 TaxID=3233015 RepID=UPI003F92D744
MTANVAAWIDAYREAWESNDPDDIRALFTADATYRTEPFAAPWSGHDEIVRGWLAAADQPGDTTFDWTTLAETDDVAIVEGTTRYRDGRFYSNLWVIRLTPGGLAREFTEWWMDQSTPS